MLGSVTSVTPFVGSGRCYEVFEVWAIWDKSSAKRVFFYEGKLNGSLSTHVHPFPASRS